MSKPKTYKNIEDCENGEIFKEVAKLLKISLSSLSAELFGNAEDGGKSDVIKDRAAVSEERRKEIDSRVLSALSEKILKAVRNGYVEMENGERKKLPPENIRKLREIQYKEWNRFLDAMAFWGCDIEYILSWIEGENFEKIYKYNQCFDNLYKHISIDAVKFLRMCKKLQCTDDGSDKREVCLKIMQDFSSKVGNIEKVFSVIEIFKNRKKIFEKVDKKYLSFIETKDQEVEREKIKRKIKKAVISDEEIRNIINFQKGKVYDGIEFGEESIIFQMDDMDWQLLILYTLIKSDDEDGEKENKIKELFQCLHLMYNAKNIEEARKEYAARRKRFDKLLLNSASNEDEAKEFIEEKNKMFSVEKYIF